MKRIDITPEIASHLRRSLGNDINPQEYIVFEAIALNTFPIRKRHPLYLGAVNDRSVLAEMASNVISESVPLMIMHDQEPLPVGRVFHGEVKDLMGESELRTLFFVDPQEEEVIRKIENGTVDQVSVSVMAREAKCSECGWNYFGEEAEFENIFFGECNNGHVIGQDGVHVKLSGLDSWFEMSLVNQGGAQNARIVNRDQSHFGSATNIHRLAASGMDPNHLVLAASPEGADTMEIQKLIDDLTTYKADLSTANSKVEDLKAALTDRDGEVERLANENEELKARVAELEATEQRATELEEKLSGAVNEIHELAKETLAQVGDVSGAALDGKETVSDYVAVIAETRARLTSGGHAVGADAGSGVPKKSPSTAAAFRLPKQ